MKSNFFKKILGIFGFKLIEKNLIKNKRLLKDKYLNLDLILDHIFVNHNIRNIIQIGSNDGKRFDPLNKFLQKNDAKTIFVEPIKKYYDKLKKNYAERKNSIFENSAISENDGVLEIFKVNENNLKFYDDHVAGISSFDKKHLLKHNVKDKHISTEKVNTLTIKSLIEKHNLKDIDLLFVDVEGHEGIIINNFFRTIDYRPIIIFEYIHINNNLFSNVLKNLKSNNYFYTDFEENLFCFPEEKKFIFKLSNL